MVKVKRAQCRTRFKREREREKILQTDDIEGSPQVGSRGRVEENGSIPTNQSNGEGRKKRRERKERKRERERERESE